LASAYSKHLKAKGLEIVFVSSDHGEDAFRHYLEQMPWLAVPFAERHLAENLMNRFGVQGIPKLVLIDPRTCEVVTSEGRSGVSRDPEGREFPWRGLQPSMGERVLVMLPQLLLALVVLFFVLKNWA
jgi:nucleoredoxin